MAVFFCVTLYLKKTLNAQSWLCAIPGIDFFARFYLFALTVHLRRFEKFIK